MQELLTIGLSTGSYFGKSEEDQKRLDAAAKGQEFIKEGVSKPVATDPNSDRTAQCIKEHGEGFFYDPELEMCSYRR